MNQKQQDNLAQTIESMMPKNLDDIIRENRNKASMGLTTDEEVDDLYFPIEIGERPTKNFIDDWILITLKIEARIPSVLLVGNVRGTTLIRVTSDVQQIDLKNNVLITKNGSVYELGKEKEGKPSLQQLMTICAVLHSWGYGQALGIPHFFF